MVAINRLKAKILKRLDNTGLNTQRVEMGKSVSYEIGLMEDLESPSFALEYLNAAAEENQEVFLLALRDVAKAKGMKVSDQGTASCQRA